MSEVTRLLSAISEGDPDDCGQLFPLLYDELRKLAVRMLTHERSDQTLQATALVHEAYVRLVDVEQSQHWSSRGHFFGAVAQAMRRILVEQARRRNAAKRGGQADREELHESTIAAPQVAEEVLALNDALDRFALVDPVAANLIQLRFFAGLTMSEAAEALGMSERSAYDSWAYARVWLRLAVRPC